jgi:acyl-coenzyme A thioesterase 13
MTLTSVKKGEVEFEFKIGPDHLNRVMSTHGGVICTLVDIAGSIAVASMTGGPDTGVSTDISVSFISGSKLNETLIVESKCHKAGRNLAFTTTHLKLKETGALVATGSHTKYIGKPPKSKL